jgi:hypothetical protein
VQVKVQVLAGVLGAVMIVLGRLAAAPVTAPVPIAPTSMRWTSPPQLPGVQSAWVLGGEQQPGVYLLRVTLTHPDERSSTVLRGTIYVGFGQTVDEAAMVAVPAGAVYVAPANVPHYVWAKDGDAEYQESGIGPTGTVRLTPSSESRSH